MSEVYVEIVVLESVPQLAIGVCDRVNTLAPKGWRNLVCSFFTQHSSISPHKMKEGHEGGTHAFCESLLCLVMGLKHKRKLHKIWLLSSLILLLLNISFCSSSDIISTDKAIRDGEVLVSQAKTFALGFFSPGKSTSRYVGIWYNSLPEKTVVWVANRNSPINDTSGILSINPDGNLVLHHNHSTVPIWSTNVSVRPSNSNNVIAQLSDIANLVLIQNSTKTVICKALITPRTPFFHT